MQGWLIVVDRCLCQEHVVAPAVGRDRIRIDPRVAVFFEKGEIGFPHLRQRVLLGEARVVDKAVGVTRRFAAGVPRLVAGPESCPAFRAFQAVKPVVLEIREFVFLVEIAHSLARIWRAFG